MKTTAAQSWILFDEEHLVHGGCASCTGPPCARRCRPEGDRAREAVVGLVLDLRGHLDR